MVLADAILYLQSSHNQTFTAMWSESLVTAEGGNVSRSIGSSHQSLCFHKRTEKLY